MAAQCVDVERYFPCSVDKLFEHLSEHENLGRLFGAAVSRDRDGDTERNGVGSVRNVKVGLSAFQETVTVFERNARIEYRITQGGLLRDHHGCMLFRAEGEGSRLHYTIRFDAAVPGLALLVRLALQRSLGRGLSELAL